MTRSAAAAEAAPPPSAPDTWTQNPGDAAVAKALLVDPDPEIASSAALHMLRRNGLAVDQVANPEAALEALTRRGYQLVILELSAQQYDGVDLCRRIVERHGPPVLVWSLRAAPLDQVAGLELGAEDYVAKTAHPLELLARVRAVLRRSRAAGIPDTPAGTRLAADSWLFDPRINSIRSWQGSRVWLRPASSALLRVFCDLPRQQIPREALLQAARSGGAEIALRTVDVMVSRLRRSLDACDGGGSLVRTVRPTGYLFDAEVTPAEGGAALIRG